MTNLEHLPPDYDQRCAAYRAALEQAYATGTVDAAARAWLEAEREHIGLQPADAQRLEEMYVREHAVALLESTRLHIAILKYVHTQAVSLLHNAHQHIKTLDAQYERERAQWERREYEREQREQAKWDRDQREREQRKRDQREREQQQQQWREQGRCEHCGADIDWWKKLRGQTRCKKCR